MPVLELIDVKKVYGGGHTAVSALSGVNLSVDAREFVAIVGPSGSGKTTLLAIAGALLSPTQGEVLLDGRDLSQLAHSELTDVRLKKLGFVLQSSNLIPYLTALDQLLLISEMSGRRDTAAKERACQLLDGLGMVERMHHYPEMLSGGERQRVTIARSLMNNPTLILADEPTASLDSQRGRDVVELLAQEARSRETAIVMVTHDERMLDSCDRVLRIDDGKLEEEVRRSSIGTHVQ